MSLQDRLDAFKKDFESNKAPPEVVAAFHKATAELIASGQAERALKAGDRAPAFTLPDADGIAVSSTELLARGPLVLTFYRGVWCPIAISTCRPSRQRRTRSAALALRSSRSRRKRRPIAAVRSARTS